jgi:hypothetical protein
MPTPEFLDTIVDSPEDEDKYKILQHLSNILTVNGGDLFSQVVFARKKGRFSPVLVTSNNEVVQIRDREDDLIKIGTKKKDIPQWEKYSYAEYNGCRLQFSHQLRFDPVHGINTVDNRVLDSILNSKVPPKTIYDDCFKIAKEYYYLPKSFEYDVFTSAVIISYIKNILGRVFYVVFFGAPGTGKSTGLRLLSLLQHNGRFCGRGTVASSIRLIHSHGISLCQDEFDKLGNDEKILLCGVFNNGFNLEGVYSITNTNVQDVLRQVVSFRTFGCKSFTGNEIGGFDPSLIDRCYVFNSAKASRSTKDVFQLNRTEMDRFQELRNQLFVYTLFHWKELRDSINSIKTWFEKEGLFGRESDKYSLVLGIIQHFKGKPYMLQVKEFLEQKAPVFVVERFQSMEYVILEALVNRLMESGIDKYRATFDVTNEELYSVLLDSLGYMPGEKYAPADTKPRKILDSLRLLEKKENLGYRLGGKRVYHINTTELAEVIRDHGYDDLLKKVSWLEALSTPKTPTTPSQKIEDSGKSEGSDGNLGKGFLSGFKNITSTQVQWAENYLRNNPPVPVHFFVCEFKNNFGDQIPDEEIHQVFTIIGNHLKNKEVSNQ